MTSKFQRVTSSLWHRKCFWFRLSGHGFQVSSMYGNCDQREGLTPSSFKDSTKSRATSTPCRVTLSFCNSEEAGWLHCAFFSSLPFLQLHEYSNLAHYTSSQHSSKKSTMATVGSKKRRPMGSHNVPPSWVFLLTRMGSNSQTVKQWVDVCLGSWVVPLGFEWKIRTLFAAEWIPFSFFFLFFFFFLTVLQLIINAQLLTPWITSSTQNVRLQCSNHNHLFLMSWNIHGHNLKLQLELLPSDVTLPPPLKALWFESFSFTMYKFKILWLKPSGFRFGNTICRIWNLKRQSSQPETSIFRTWNFSLQILKFHWLDFDMFVLRVYKFHFHKLKLQSSEFDTSMIL